MTQTRHKLILFGQPVAHSLSPRVQQAFAAQFDLSIDYSCQEVGTAGFEEAVNAFFADGGHGANVTVPHKRAAFDGVAAPLLEAGIESLHIANRTQDRAVAMAEELDDRVQAVAMESLAALGAVDLLIHATSAGHSQQTLELPDTLVDRTTVCCDLSYGAAAEPFLQWAQRTGAAQAFDGLGMLVETAADSFELWFGRRPETEAVYRALHL